MSDLAYRNFTRYEYMRDSGHSDFVRKADKCDRHWAGEQWDEADLARLRKQKRPALTINMLLSRLGIMMGEQVQLRTDTVFYPKGKSGSVEVANALTKLYMHIGEANNLEFVRSNVFDDGVIRSRGFFDVRMDFSDNINGEVRITQLNSKNVLIDPDAQEFDPDEWNDVIVTKWMAPEDIGILYSEAAAETLRARDASVFPYGYDSIEMFRDRFSGDSVPWYYGGLYQEAQLRRFIRVIDRQYFVNSKQKFFVDPATGDMRAIPDTWTRDRIVEVRAMLGLEVLEFMRKRIKWCVTADDIVLHESWSPYKHFTVVPYFPYFRHGRTVGMVENLIGPQELLNKTRSQELHVINTTANSGWKVKTGSLVNMTMGELEEKGAETGLVLELNDVAGAEKIQPNQIPTGLDRVGSHAEGYIEKLSVPDAMLGMDRADVPAKATLARQKGGSKLLTKIFANLAHTDKMLAQRVLDCVQKFYTEERVVRITKNRLTNEQEELTVNAMSPEGTIVNDLTLGEYGIIIGSQPDKDTFEQSQFEQAVQMRAELGIAVPDEFIIENSNLASRATLAKALKERQESPEAQAERELKMRDAMAEVTLKEAKGQSESAEAKLRSSRAVKEAQVVAQGGENLDPMKKYEVDQKYAFERWKAEEEFALREKELRMERAQSIFEANLKAKEAKKTTPSKSKGA